MNSDTEEIQLEYVPPLGARFSQLYLRRSAAESDSQRLRRRIGSFFKNELYDYASEASHEIESGIGTDFNFSGYGSSVAEYLNECIAADFRDAITMIYRAIQKRYERDHYNSHQVNLNRWRKFCEGAFVEENVAFRVDYQCVVRPFVDQEFATATAAILRGLDDPRLAAVRAEAEASIDRLGGRSADPKASVRSAFEAIEIYTKLAVTSCRVARLNRKLVVEHIAPALISRAGCEPEAKSIAHFIDGLADWVDACHIYRHGQGVNEPAPPPPELAVALVASGLGYLRFLLDGLPLPSGR